MVAWKGQDFWPSPREGGGEAAAAFPPFSFRPTRGEAGPGKRVVQAPAVPSGQAGGLVSRRQGWVPEPCHFPHSRRGGGVDI